MQRATVLWIAMVGFVVLFGASTTALGTLPDSTDDGPRVVAWFADHDSNVRVAVWLTALSLILFAVFAALVRTRLPAVWRDLFIGGAWLLIGETSVQMWILAGLARRPSNLDPAMARTLLDVMSYWGPVLTVATVLMLAPVAITAFGGDGLPRWVGYVAGVALVEQLVETITILGRTGFIAPGGPMNLVLGAGLTTIALLCAGVAVARAD